MQKLLIALLAIGLAVSIGCDEPAEEPEEEPTGVEEEVDEEYDEEEDEDEEAEADDEEADEQEAAQAEDGVIEVTATANAFEPSTIEAPAGEELTVKFTRTTGDGCMTEVVFPDLEIEEELPEGETVDVAVTPEEGDAIAFECGMGMGESTITGI